MRETRNIGSRFARGFKKGLAGALALSMVVTAVPATGLAGALEAKAAGTDTLTVYRSYNESSGEHLYTTDAGEHQFVVQSGRVDEKEAWIAPSKSNTEVYRSYNPTSGEHLLVPKSEAEGLVAFGWNNEGLKMYSDDEKGVAIYRVFNPNAPEQGPGCAGSHHYTASKAEAEALVAAGWKWDNNGEPVLYGVDENASVEVEGVTLSNTTPKVGDTINATVSPEDVKDAKYSWLADGKAIEGATEASYKVTKDDLGKKISVRVDAGGATVTSDETTAVVSAEAEKIELISAEQTGAATIEVKFSNKATANDKITVKRGSVDQTIDVDYATDRLSAILTLGTKMSDATYTVTLTPGDKTQQPTSKEIVAKSTKLTRIEFLNNKLVMSGPNYNEGYTFVKGYNDFDEEVTLSGVTITAGIGTATYKASTGLLKITAAQNAFLNMKEVYVYVLDTANNISASANLEVSSQAFVTEMTLGDIQKDGTKRSDGLLTIEELKSGKYYVPVTGVKDQYGNTVDVETLNKMIDNNTLFLIPNTTTGTYYAADEFATLKDGSLVIPLKKGNGKPGTMNLTVTSANGSTFQKEVTISDDSYINELTVSVPDLYANTATTLEFTAKDQYGEDIDLWDFKPTADNVTGELNFSDSNNLTSMNTKISTANITWKVTEDTAKKTFKVTATPGNVKDSTIVFTVTTAGQKVSTVQRKVAATAAPASIRKTLSGGDTTLSATNNTFDFGKYLTFIDDSGAVVTADAPIPVNIMKESAGTVQADAVNPDSAINDNPTNYYWVITKGAPNENTTTPISVTGTHFGDINGDGTITVSDGVVTLNNTGVDTPGDYVFYATLYTNGKNGGWFALDQQKFTLTVANEGLDKKTKFAAEIDGGKKTLFTGKDSDDKATIKVYGTNNGVTFQMAQGTGNNQYYLEVNKGLEVSGSDIEAPGDDIGSGTATVTVWAKVSNGTTYEKTAVATVSLPYSNADAVQSGWSIHDVTDDKDLSTTEFDKVNTANLVTHGVAVINGILYFENNDHDIKVNVVDQYGRAMEDAKWTLDGEDWAEGVNIKTNKTYTVKGSMAKIEGITLSLGASAATTTDFVENNKKATVKSAVELNTALSEGKNKITLDKDIAATKAIVVADGQEIVIPSEYTLDTGDFDVTVEAGGLITVEGTWTSGNGGAPTITNDGTVEGPGHVTLSGVIITTAGPGAGTWNVSGNTLVLNNVTFNGDQELKGHIQVENAISIAGGVTVTLSQNEDEDGNLEDTQIEFAPSVNYAGVAGTFEVAAESTVNIVAGDGTSQVADNSGDTANAAPITFSETGASGSTVEVTERTMAPLKTILTTNNALDSGIDFSQYINATGAAISADPEYTWDADKQEATYTYVVTGEAAYVASLPGFGSAYHWGLGIQIASANATSAATIKYGAKLSEGTYEVNSGWMTEEDADMNWYAIGWKTIPDTDAKKQFVVRYEFADGSAVNHVYDLTAFSWQAAEE